MKKLGSQIALALFLVCIATGMLSLAGCGTSIESTPTGVSAPEKPDQSPEYIKGEQEANK